MTYERKDGIQRFLILCWRRPTDSLPPCPPPPLPPSLLSPSPCWPCSFFALATTQPRDSSSADGASMEPKWWRQGPGANSEYTGHDMDGELFDPPDEKVFKPFYMKSSAKKQQLFDVDGPSPRDSPRQAWKAGGKGTTAWMLAKEGPLLASQQGPSPARKALVMRKQTLREAPAHPVRFYDADGPSPKDPPRASWAKGGKGTTAWMLAKEAKEGKLVAQQQGPLADQLPHSHKQAAAVHKGQLAVKQQAAAATGKAPHQDKQAAHAVMGQAVSRKALGAQVRTVVKQ